MAYIGNLEKGSIISSNGNINVEVPPGADGTVLTADSSSSSGLSYQASAGGAGFNTINIVKIESTGTYTPTLGMKFCVVEIVGGGGSTAGISSTTVSQYRQNSGGGGGGYCKRVFDSVDIGVSQLVTVGLGGAAGIAGGFGNAGGNTSFGAFMTANGGSPGSSGLFTGQGGVATGGDINIQGQAGFTSSPTTTTPGFPGAGGSSMLGFGGRVYAVASTGNPGQNYGGGASGQYNPPSSPDKDGSAGAPGVCIITEYI